MIYTPPDYKILYEDAKRDVDFLQDRVMKAQLTLRDKFAMAALPQVLSETTWEKIGDTGQYRPNYVLVAEMSYMIADAMLQQREEK